MSDTRWEAQKQIRRIHKEIIQKAIEDAEGTAVTEVLISVSDLEKLDSFMDLFAYQK